MCQPIYNSEQQIVGVAQMLNKCNKANFSEDFTEQDEKLFEVRQFVSLVQRFLIIYPDEP